MIELVSQSCYKPDNEGECAEENGNEGGDGEHGGHHQRPGRILQLNIPGLLNRYVIRKVFLADAQSNSG